MSPGGAGDGAGEGAGGAEGGHGDPVGGNDPAEAGLTTLDRVDRQAAALAFLPGSDPLRVVVVTSRRTGRWLLPKGGIDEGLNGPATAVMEAYEEAGVIGPVEPVPIGRYAGRKIRPPHAWTLEVEVFALAVREVRDAWPEAGQRERRFVTIGEALDLLDEPAVAAIVGRFGAARG